MKKISVVTLFAGLFALGGFITMICFLINLSGQFSLFANTVVDLEASSKVGDFIGGVVGAVWSFAGVLLFFYAVRLQSEELSLQRQEFVVNRLTNIVYQQISRIDTAIEKFESTANGKPFKSGINGINDLNISLQKRLDIFKKLDIVLDNERALTMLFNNILNSLKAVNKLLLKSNIDQESKEDLNQLLIENVGITLVELISDSKHWHEKLIENKSSANSRDATESIVISKELTIQNLSSLGEKIINELDSVKIKS